MYDEKTILGLLYHHTGISLVILMISLAAGIEVNACSSDYSFTHGPFTYHVIVACVGSNMVADNKCKTMNGSLAMPRSKVVLSTISDFLFLGIKASAPGKEEDTKILLRRKRSSSSSSSEENNNPGNTNNGGAVVEVNNPEPTTQQATTSTMAQTSHNPSTTNSEAQTSPSTTSDSTPTTTNIPFNEYTDKVPTNTSLQMISTSAPVFFKSFTFWTQPYLLLPSLNTADDDADSGTCGWLKFEESPVSDEPQIDVDISNDCQSFTQKFSWICETVHDDYSSSIDLPSVSVKSKTETVMDSRPSAVSIGTVAIGIISTCLLALVSLDVINVIEFFRSSISTSGSNNIRHNTDAKYKKTSSTQVQRKSKIITSP